MRYERCGRRVAMFRYIGADTRRDVLARLRQMTHREGRVGGRWRAQRKVLFRDVSLEVAAEELRKIRDEGSLFTTDQVRELIRQGRSELTQDVVRPFTKRILLTVIWDIELPSIPAFTLTLAPSNNLPVIGAELWLGNGQLAVGGYIEVSQGGEPAVEEVRLALKVGK